jgi:hypothetical protein
MTECILLLRDEQVTAGKSHFVAKDNHIDRVKGTRHTAGITFTHRSHSTNNNTHDISISLLGLTKYSLLSLGSEYAFHIHITTKHNNKLTRLLHTYIIIITLVYTIPQ